jgi:sugar lactone lactonase YvrE
LFDEPVTLLADGFEFLEGPVWLSASIAEIYLHHAPQGALIFNDIPASRTHWWAEGQVGVLRDCTNQANGNAIDGQQHVLACEHRERRVVRYGPDLVAHVVASHYRGRRLNSPNDLVVDRSGSIFFTDPPYGTKPEFRELDYQGVYCISPASDQPQLLLDDFVKPNGLAFSPDERTLYIADTERGHIRAFDRASDGTLIEGRTYCEIDRPDGIRVDVAGRIYVAGMSGIEVFGTDGAVVAQLPMSERPANLAFGGRDGRTLFITARTGLYQVRAATPGCGIGVE